MYNDYPELKGFIDTIELTDGLKGIIGTDLKLVDGNVKGIIKIDSQYFKNIKTINRLIKEQVEEKYWTNKDGLFGILMHEATHLLEYKHILKNNKIKLTGVNKDEFNYIKMIAKYGSLSSKIRKNALKICKLEDEYDIIKENVSRYACINSKEFLAECCSYKKTSKLAIVTRQLFLQELRGE